MRTVREEPDGNDEVNDKLPEADDLDLLYGYRRAASYLSIGEIYLLDNPPRQEPCGGSISSRACSDIEARHPG